MLFSNNIFAKAQKIDIPIYIYNHKALANVLYVIYGIPQAVILSVAIVESSAGTGEAAKVLNNHFGIVGNNRFITKRGTKSRYKQYYNEIVSYIDFCITLSHKKYYHKLKYKKNTKIWVQAISKANYSEQPTEWEHKILQTIARYRL